MKAGEALIGGVAVEAIVKRRRHFVRKRAPPQRLFEDLVGLDEIKVIHLNDSKGPLGSNLDRHEHIGLGHIGEKGFRSFFRYSDIASRTIIMETPLEGEKENLADLRTAKKLIA